MKKEGSNSVCKNSCYSIFYKKEETIRYRDYPLYLERIKMKKTQCFLVLMIVLISTFPGVKASSSDEWIVKVHNGDLVAYNTLTSEKIKDSYEVNEEGELVLIPIEKIVDVLNSIEDIQEETHRDVDIMPMEVPMTYYSKTFTKSDEYRVTGAAKRISNDQLDSGALSASKSISLTMSISSGIGVDAMFKSAVIKASASIGLTSSISQTITHSLDKKYGRGYLGFYPYYQKVIGTGHKKTYSQSGHLLSTQNYPTTATIPLVFNGQPFGMWAIIYY